MMADEAITKSMEELTTVDEYINHFTEMGFKVLKDTENDGTRTLMLRKYVMDEHGEVIIKQSDSKISVTQTLNGKKVV
jgi:hypothetical protein